jgi:tripartite-type tricarboxylate transporter receptor subunit TctC
VVPFAPGGSTDVLTRLMAERMTEVLGRPVQVENRPGGNTIIGAEYAARAQPDGHTILMAAGTTLTINPVIYRTLPYKLEDFAPITLCSTFPFAVIARKDGPADIPAMIAAAKARPGQITYGTNGPTTLTNVAMHSASPRRPRCRPSPRPRPGWWRKAGSACWPRPVPRRRRWSG